MNFRKEQSINRSNNGFIVIAYIKSNLNMLFAWLLNEGIDLEFKATTAAPYEFMQSFTQV